MTRHHPKPTLTLPGIERAPIDGDALGASWEAWLDRVLYLPHGRAVHYDAKACALTTHPNRWALPASLRADQPSGHQVARGQRLAALGHRAAIVLGVWDAGWARIYVLPITPAGLPPGASVASRTWDELEPYRTRNPYATLCTLAIDGVTL